MPATPNEADECSAAVRRSSAAALSIPTGPTQPRVGLVRDCLTTGSVCRYDPDPARRVEWELSAGRAPASVPHGPGAG